MKTHLPCPDCGSSDALSDYGDHTFCFVCKTRKNAEGVAAVPKETGVIPPGHLSFISIPARGLYVETCKMYSYGIYKDTHVACYYSNDNSLVAQKVRTRDKEFFSQGSIKKAIMFGQNVWRNHGGKRIVITEGEIDCLSVAQAFDLKWPVVSIINGSSGAAKDIKANLEFIESFEEIVLWFDNDEPGKKATAECAPLFKPGKVKIVNPVEGIKDANEMLTKKGASQVTKAVWEAKVYRPDGILCGTDIGDRLDSYRRGDNGGSSFELPYPLLNEKIRGARKRRVYTVIAAPKIGKSTLVKELGYHLLMNHGLKIASFAIEESIEETALILMGMYLNRPGLHVDPKGSCTDEEFEEAKRTVVGNGRLFLFDHFGSLDPNNLISKFRYMAVGLGVDFILFDHVSMVVSGSDASVDERRLLDKIETDIRSLVEETGVGVIQVAHIKKGDGSDSDPAEGGRVTASDVRGSGSIAQISDFLIALEGNTQDETNSRKLRVIYNRLTGNSGECDDLEYSRKTGRLLPFSQTAF